MEAAAHIVFPLFGGLRRDTMGLFSRSCNLRLFNSLVEAATKTSTEIISPSALIADGLFHAFNWHFYLMSLAVFVTYELRFRLDMC